MADKTLQEMKAELEAAGYMIEGRIDNWWYEIEILTPDNWYIESQAYLAASDEAAQEEAETDTIPRAYAHLQQKRRLAQLEAFVNEIANTSYFGYSDFSVESMFVH